MSRAAMWACAALAAAGAFWSGAGGSGTALAGAYEFLAAPQTNLNRIYRLDKATGEVGACQYGLKEGTIGVTICYPSGEGAGAQTPGEYALVSSRHEQEAGVFRVDQRSGGVAICYVYNEAVVCTPPGK